MLTILVGLPGSGKSTYAEASGARRHGRPARAYEEPSPEEGFDEILFVLPGDGAPID